MKTPAALLLLLLLTAALPARSIITPFADVILAPFQSVSADKPGAAWLVGIEAGSGTAGLGWVARLSTSAEPSRFRREGDFDCFIGAEPQFALRHMVVDFETTIQEAAGGVRLAGSLGPVACIFDMMIGSASYGVSFPQYGTSFTAVGFTYRTQLQALTQVGPVTVGASLGYLSATSPVLRTSSGSAIQGTLDYGGVTLGLRIGSTF